MKATISRKVHFNAAHRLNNPAWTEAKNKELFGKCNNENYHGHNYVLEAKVKGDIDEPTGYVMDTKVLKDILEKEIVERFDHKNLNLDTKEFMELNPTAENMALVIHGLVSKQIGNNKELTIILHETERNYVEYDGKL
ncbi:MAG: 6-pyruvoyl trahydropterin synthase family protein [Bacteroidia bacterium]